MESYKRQVMQIVNDTTQTTNTFLILARSKKEKEIVKKAVKAFGFAQLTFGPETKNQAFIEVHVSSPIDLYYIGQYVQHYRLYK